ncbi:RidA family protein [Shewanella sp. SP2S2-6]|uniref:RidA family protein n=1 Tax=Shewanella sp. SP2S2-6 TaxID=3063540 RepID=UPI00288EBD87|nr:RidA family protein [Shewanella sp. SP2S2-6]MDT3297528.1 RidA family protein [Shewanella sp. SP2S2-6]
MKYYPTTMPFPFSKAVEVNGLLFLSGQVSMSQEGEPIYGTIEEQIAVIFQRIAATLEECGSSMNNIVKVSVWLSDMKHFSSFNAAYSKHFESELPARTTTVSPLAFGLDVEIEVLAMVK